MTISLHPSKDSPERYRVYNKRLNIQEFFNFREHGEIRAKELAEAREETIQRKLKCIKLIDDLLINRIFDKAGKVRGLQKVIRKSKKHDVEVLIVQFTPVKGEKQVKRESTITGRTFEIAYKEIQKKILAAYNVEMSLELRQAFKIAKRMHW